MLFFFFFYLVFFVDLEPWELYCWKVSVYWLFYKNSLDGVLESVSGGVVLHSWKMLVGFQWFAKRKQVENEKRWQNGDRKKDL